MKKKTIKSIKPLPQKESYRQSLNYNIEKVIQPDKINPKKIFEGFVEQVPKDNKKQKKSKKK